MSSCLLGERVRYDRGHKRNQWITRTLARHFELVPICPEVAIGLGVPRPPIHLVKRGNAVRAVGELDSSLDVTRALSDYGTAILRAMPDLCGYLFKSRSPSCGLRDVQVTGERRPGAGVYAFEIVRREPLLPVTDESDLDDLEARENFIRLVLAFAQIRALLAAPTTAGLIAFHTNYKYLLLAHSTVAYRNLGRVVAAADRRNFRRHASEYATLFMRTMAHKPTIARHANVLQHMAGFLRTCLNARQRANLADSIEAFRLGRVPRAILLARIRGYLRKHPDEWLARQVYLDPLPISLASAR